MTCDEIVRSLPYHFGNEAGREQCAEAVRRQSGLVTVSGDAVVGFLTWRPWLGSSFEISRLFPCGHGRSAVVAAARSRPGMPSERLAVQGSAVSPCR